MSTQLPAAATAALRELRLNSGVPDDIHRSDAWALDTYRWPDGRWVRLHDDGRMTVGKVQSSIEVSAVRRFPNGGQVVLQFEEIANPPRE
jgi:hypothetical protein